MGWKLKALALIFALVLIGYRAWPFAIPLFLYTLSGPILLIFTRKRKSAHAESAQLPNLRSQRRRTRLLLNLMGVVLLALALFAFIVGGKLSPYVFASVGLLILLTGPISRSALFPGLQAVNDSILLKKSMKPFSWVTLAEVKLLTRNVERAMILTSERVLVVTSEKPSIYVIVEEFAFSRRGVEEKILERLKNLTKTVAPFGVYLLPLDSDQAAGVLTEPIEAINLQAEDTLSFLSSGRYDLLSLQTVGGAAALTGAFKRTEGKKRAKASLPTSRPGPRLFPALEVFRRIGERVEWPNPDEYTAFLTSMLATQYLPEGQRIIESATSVESKTVLAKSLGTPLVELSKSQLSATMKIYA